jgi:hypothetical protein
MPSDLIFLIQIFWMFPSVSDFRVKFAISRSALQSASTQIALIIKSSFEFFIRFFKLKF